MVHRRLEFALIAAFFAGHLGIFGCDRGNEGQDGGVAAVVRSAAADSIELKLSVTPGELPFDERVQLIIEATAEGAVTVELRDYRELIRESGKQFELRALRKGREEARPAPGNKRRWTDRYEVEFFLPGEHELPGAAALYFGEPIAPSSDHHGIESADASESDSSGKSPTGDRDDAAESSGSFVEHQTQSLATEPLTIVALETALAQSSVAELDKIRTLPPVELREPWSAWWVAGAAAIVVLAAAAIWLLRRRVGRVEPEIRVPAHEWARRVIALLIAENLIEKGRVQEFYYRISDILRGYIERRYSVHAREMTTEEFLAAAARDARFGPEATVELNRFLTACDMVKYARFVPDQGESHSLLRTAMEFVEQTRERVGPVGGDSTTGGRGGESATEKERAA